MIGELCSLVSFSPETGNRDVAPEGKTLQETNAKLDKIIEIALKLQKESGIQLLWGTAQLFKHPRYMHGAATSGNLSFEL